MASSASEPVIGLVVGLGNPGPRYAGNRHNVGVMVLDELARRLDAGRPANRFAGTYRQARGPAGQVGLLTPQTFMNDSGRSVGPAAGRVVAIRAGNLLATAFHPEVTGDYRIHEYFMQMVRAALC